MKTNFVDKADGCTKTDESGRFAAIYAPICSLESLHNLRGVVGSIETGHNFFVNVFLNYNRSDGDDWDHNKGNKG